MRIIYSEHCVETLFNQPKRKSKKKRLQKKFNKRYGFRTKFNAVYMKTIDTLVAHPSFKEVIESQEWGLGPRVRY